jgi:hypothetical protein
MPAPKNPNTQNARAALAAKRAAARLERLATELRDAGWLVMKFGDLVFVNAGLPGKVRHPDEGVDHLAASGDELISGLVHVRAKTSHRVELSGSHARIWCTEH